MTKYYAPAFELNAFNCIHCGVYARQVWYGMRNVSGSGIYNNDSFRYCTCIHCKAESYWYQGRMIVPTAAPVQPSHPDLPEDCKADYDEARDVVARSPKAAAALMRLVLQKLMVDLGEKGKNINDDIASLVSKGLPVVVQQALDYCRVVGNNSVHPGEINLNDTPEVAHSLFEMVNFIVDDRIARPKQVQALYGKLPKAHETPSKSATVPRLLEQSSRKPAQATEQAQQ
jgi:hypothetical protein